MNTVWSFCDAATGLFVRGSMSVPQGIDPATNTPAGCVPVAGRHDPQRVRLDITTGAVVPYLPPAPADDALRTWRWDETAWAWLPTPTPAALAAQARVRRAELLAACDWVILRAAERQQPVPPAWADYRAALRDITLQPGFPVDIKWPVAPI